MCDPVTAVAAIATAVVAPKLIKAVTPKAPAASTPVSVGTPAPTPAAPAAPTYVTNNNSSGGGTEQAPPTPQAQDKPVQDAIQKQKRARLRGAAEGSTLITGGSGIAAPADTGLKTAFGQ
jgi:hypothetical protein